VGSPLMPGERPFCSWRCRQVQSTFWPAWCDPLKTEHSQQNTVGEQITNTSTGTRVISSQKSQFGHLVVASRQSGLPRCSSALPSPAHTRKSMQSPMHSRQRRLRRERQQRRAGMPRGSDACVRAAQSVPGDRVGGHVKPAAKAGAVAVQDANLASVGRISPDCPASRGWAWADADTYARGSGAPFASPRPRRACQSRGTSLSSARPASAPAVEHIACAVTCCLHTMSFKT